MAVRVEDINKTIETFQAEEPEAYNWLTTGLSEEASQINDSYRTYERHFRMHPTFKPQNEAESLCHIATYAMKLVSTQNKRVFKDIELGSIMPNGDEHTDYHNVVRQAFHFQKTVNALHDIGKDVAAAGDHPDAVLLEQTASLRAQLIATHKELNDSLALVRDQLQAFKKVHAGSPDNRYSVLLAYYLDRTYSQMQLIAQHVNETITPSQKTNVDQMPAKQITGPAIKIEIDTKLERKTAAEIGKEMQHKRPDLYKFLTRHDWRPPIAFTEYGHRISTPMSETRHNIERLMNEIAGLEDMGREILMTVPEIAKDSREAYADWEQHHKKKVELPKGWKGVITDEPVAPKPPHPDPDASHRPYDAFLPNAAYGMHIHAVAKNVQKLSTNLDPLIHPKARTSAGVVNSQDDMGGSGRTTSTKTTPDFVRDAKSYAKALRSDTEVVLKDLAGYEMDCEQGANNYKKSVYNPLMLKAVDLCKREIYPRIHNNIALLEAEIEKLNDLYEAQANGELTADAPAAAKPVHEGAALVSSDEFAKLRAAQEAKRKGAAKE